MFKKGSIFDIAKKTGKKVVFILFEDKVYVTLADKKVDGTITFEIKRGFRTENYSLQIQPEQEFILHSPKIEMAKNPVDTIYDYILNFDLNYQPRNPKDVVFSLQPYDVECLFLVYPHEILNIDTLKNLGLIEVGDAKLATEGKTLTLKAYSPTIFALDKQTIKLLSAKSRISQIDTILAMMRDLLLRSEGLFGVEKPKFLSFIFNWRILLPVILITIAIVAALVLSQFMGSITHALGGVTVPRMVPTFP